ncbi:MAG: gliding motility-associated C-terminal domain-containing protein [Bacteroidia bacterium]
MSSRKDIERFDDFFREAFDGKEAAHTSAEMDADWNAVKSHLPATGSTAGGTAASGSGSFVVASSVVAVLTAALIAIIVIMSGNENNSTDLETSSEINLPEPNKELGMEQGIYIDQEDEAPARQNPENDKETAITEQSKSSKETLVPATESLSGNDDRNSDLRNSSDQTSGQQPQRIREQSRQTVNVEQPANPPLPTDKTTEDLKRVQDRSVTISDNTRAAVEDLKLTAKTLCLNSSVILTTSSAPQAAFYWLKGEGIIEKLEKNTELAFTSAGEKQVWIIKKINGISTDTAILTLTVHETPESEFVTDITRMPNIAFNNTSREATSYRWVFGDGTVSNDLSPQHRYNLSGLYRPSLIAINDYGCRDTFTDRLQIEAESSLDLANTFTPNGDGINDRFEVLISGETYFEFSVIDRSGNKVFHSKEKSNSWDGTDSRNGKPLPSGTYYYVLQYKLQGQHRPVTQTGAIALIRD